MDKIKKFTDFLNEKKASVKQLEARKKFIEMIKGKKNKKEDDSEETEKPKTKKSGKSKK